MTKRSIYIIGGIIIAVILVIGIWLFITSKNSAGNIPSQSTGSLPPVQIKTQSGTSVPVQNILSPQNTVVAQDFLSQVQNETDQIALGGTVVASPYALQIWGDANTGGEALLEQSSSGQWSLVSLAGGEWTAVALMQEGVPESIAQQLVAGLGAGASGSATSSPLTIPSGNTITIGTSKGNVVVNNFYNNATYIAQQQQEVVIEQSSTYDIVYNIPDSSFTISIFSAPVDTARQSAENAFLSDLNISQQSACKLNAYESVTINVPNESDESSPLSFCGIQQPVY